MNDICLFYQLNKAAIDRDKKITEAIEILKSTIGDFDEALRDTSWDDNDDLFAQYRAGNHEEMGRIIAARIDKYLEDRAEDLIDDE